MGVYNPIAGGGHIIQDEGMSLAARQYLNFVGTGVTASDDAANNATLVTISGSASGYITEESFVTSGGTQTVVVSNNPTSVLLVVVNGQALSVAAGDYSVSGTSINLLNPNTPAGQDIAVLYTYVIGPVSSTNIITDTFSTAGGRQTVTLSQTPITVLLVIVGGQSLSLSPGDYSVVGTSVNILNPGTPAGLDIKILYTY